MMPALAFSKSRRSLWTWGGSPPVCVVDEGPFVKVRAPVNLRSLEILRDLGDGLRRLYLVGRINLEQTPLRFQKAVVLAVADVAPRTAGHEIRLVGQAHQALKECLELVALRSEKRVLKSLLIVGILQVHDLRVCWLRVRFNRGEAKGHSVSGSPEEDTNLETEIDVRSAICPPFGGAGSRVRPAWTRTDRVQVPCK